MSRVQFSEALTQLCLESTKEADSNHVIRDNKTLVLIEVGPHASLRRPVTDTARTALPKANVIYESILKQSESACQTSLQLVGRLHCLGKAVNLSAINGAESTDEPQQTLVDLPEYPFNHERRYWLESRLSSNHRLRRLPRHDFLGVPSPDWNPLQPRWRNIIRRRENPWIADHRWKEITKEQDVFESQSQEKQLYPFGGMLVMAIEAARQLIDTSMPVSGFRFRRVRILRALNVSMDDEGTETELFIRPQQQSGTMQTPRLNFSLYALANAEWLEVITGSLIVEHILNETEVDHGKERMLQTSDSRQVYERISSKCKYTRKADEYYKDIQAFGFTFGPSFQTLSNIKFSGDGAVLATVNPDYDYLG